MPLRVHESPRPPLWGAWGLSCDAPWTGGCIHGCYVDLARVNGGRVSDYGRQEASPPKVPTGTESGK